MTTTYPHSFHSPERKHVKQTTRSLWTRRAVGVCAGLLLTATTPFSTAQAEVRYIGKFTLESHSSNVDVTPPSSVITTFKYRLRRNRLQVKLFSSPYFSVRKKNRGTIVSGTGSWYRSSRGCKTKLAIISETPGKRSIKACFAIATVCGEANVSASYCGTIIVG